MSQLYRYTRGNRKVSEYICKTGKDDTPSRWNDASAKGENHSDLLSDSQNKYLESFIRIPQGSNDSSWKEGIGLIPKNFQIFERKFLFGK